MKYVKRDESTFYLQQLNVNIEFMIICNSHLLVEQNYSNNIKGQFITFIPC